ncbi:MAG: glycoside hydrolase family 125 protein [Eubacteriales bacterium]
MNEFEHILKGQIEKVSARLHEMGRDDLIPLFKNCYPNTLETTTKILADGTSFVITGDIHAMWLRDSAAQVHHYLPVARENAELADIIEKMINRYSVYLPKDPYANAFNENGDDPMRGHHEDITFRSPWVWERKYEVDSLCSVLFIAYKFWKKVGRVSHFTPEFKNSINIILDLWETEQYHAEKSPYTFERPNPWKPSDTMTRGGKGEPVGYTGMTWSAFRPSDDACIYNYLIPSEMYAVVTLGYAAEIAREIYHDEALATRCEKLASEIDDGIQKFGIVEDPDFGKIYAYETDGLGNYNLMDDANVPSLLSIPYIGYRDKDDPIYQNTRRFILSRKNPYYYEGKILHGIGSPHTDPDCVWPIALVLQGLTTDDKDEIEEILSMLVASHDDTYFMHESIHVDDPHHFSRTWFAWANSIFSELILKYAGFEI